jgi:5-methyltetrahydrofolate--homocysteine methyltransferase
MAEFHTLSNAVIDGNAPAAVEETDTLLAAGVAPEKIVYDYLTPAMDEVGRRFEGGEYFLPELLIAARAMKTAMEKLQPLLAAQSAEFVGKVVIGTVTGDLHDIGKKLVASMLEGSGFKVLDLGNDVSAVDFVNAAREADADIIGMSALLSSTMPAMTEVISALEAASLRDRVKVLIGGAPVTEQYANQIGADGYADNASSAVAMARQMVGKA